MRPLSVDESDEGASLALAALRSHAISFDIEFGLVYRKLPSGAIQGWSTRGSGRIETIQTPESPMSVYGALGGRAGK